MTRETLWVCPICRERLIRAENTLRCDQGHSYDIAKGGYVNLLLVNQKGSASPGDSQEMIVSRRTFLEKGYYAPLSDWINQRVRRSPLPPIMGESEVDTEAAFPVPPELGARGPRDGFHPSILDAGCGEGYYLDRLRQHLTPQGKIAFESDYYGLDISKEAVKLAAQKYKGMSFAVASLHQALPFLDVSFDVILSVFAPRNAPEFARVLRPGGAVIVVVPAEGHLAQLQEALGLGRIKGDKERPVVEAFQETFSLDRQETLRYRKTVEKADILHLLRMIPTGWQLSGEAWSRAQALPRLEIEFAFSLFDLRRRLTQVL